MKIIEKIVPFIITMIFFALMLSLILMATGCVRYPEVKDFKENIPDSCIRYERCLYFSASSKTPIDCAILFDRCSKDSVFNNYFELKKKNLLPSVPFNNAGKFEEKEMPFQEYWDKVK